MRARWKLGRALAEIGRGGGPGRGKKDVAAGNIFFRACSGSGAASR
jgi:hypothetical protein